jgi:methylated-DNA-[protein]-cysteine S-methyltransferase
MPDPTARTSGRSSSTSRSAWPDEDLATGVIDTPVGLLTVIAGRLGLVKVRWGNPDVSTTGRPPIADPGWLLPALEQLSAYFRGSLRRFDLPLDLRGTTNTQQMVLETLYHTVPYGSSVTYGELACRSNTGVPARGIGSIMGSNPVPIVIPCHRVVAHNGLGGYSGGPLGEELRTKRWLLTLEGVIQPTLDWTEEF